MPSERLFFAVPISDALSERLQELQEIALETLTQHRIRDVRAENLVNSHITIRFLGDIANPTSLIDRVNRSTLSTSSFSFSINSIGVFLDVEHAKVLWAGVNAAIDFSSLRSEIDQLLQINGIEQDAQAFTPHLTLARFKTPQDLSNCIGELRQLTEVCNIARYEVNEVVLYKSELSPQGATHTKRALLKLAVS